MNDRRTIVVVAPDTDLRRSLAFALETEGYVVEAFAALRPAHGLISVAGYALVDARVLKNEEDVWLSLGILRSRAVLLTSGVISYADCGAAAELATPFDGNELFELLRHMPPAAAT